jgi:hypothetical protein
MKYQKSIYLAAPYSHWNPLVRWQRFRKVNKRAAQLMDLGYIVFSPISHSHPISRYTKADSCDSRFWCDQDLYFLEHCDEVWIYCLPGWEKSKGINEEMAIAAKLGKHVRLI